jgi:hypothetical protein
VVVVRDVGYRRKEAVREANMAVISSRVKGEGTKQPVGIAFIPRDV